MIPHIRSKAVCVLRRGHEILVVPGQDPMEGRSFFVPPGGGVEFAEHSSEAVRREVREELGIELDAPVLIGVFENVFEYRGVVEHEVVFAYSARFADSSLYSRDTFPGVESNGVPFVAEWRDIATFQPGGALLYPEGLIGKLRPEV